MGVVLGAAWAGAFVGVLAGVFDVVLAEVFIGVFVETFVGVLAGVLSPGLGVEFVVATDIGFELGVVGVDVTLEILEEAAVGFFLVPGVDLVLVCFFFGLGVSAGGLTGILIGAMGRSLSSSSEYISSSTTPSWSLLLIGRASAY